MKRSCENINNSFFPYLVINSETLQYEVCFSLCNYDIDKIENLKSVPRIPKIEMFNKDFNSCKYSITCEDPKNIRALHFGIMYVIDSPFIVFNTNLFKDQSLVFKQKIDLFNEIYYSVYIGSKHLLDIQAIEMELLIKKFYNHSEHFKVSLIELFIKHYHIFKKVIKHINYGGN